MPAKIEKKIVAWAVKAKSTESKDDTSTPKNEDTSTPTEPTVLEHVKRPEYLSGGTYKIKPPTAEHALYLTFSDIEVDGVVRPYEVFVHCKNMDDYQWVIALTRVVSAIFRKGGEVAFLVDEFKDVFDPRGGYFKKGTYMNSVVAEIGYALETHLYEIGFLKREELTDTQKNYIAEKKEELGIPSGEGEESFPPSATVCKACGKKAVMRLDGCDTCLSCGYSKCG